MTARASLDPSPFKSALVHSTLGALTLIGTLGIGGAIVHITGSADASSPAVRMALFDEIPADTPQLNPRLPGYRQAVGFAGTTEATAERFASANEPSLGVDYSNSPAQPASVVTKSGPEGITINGKTVMPGQSLSQVDGQASIVQVAARVAEDTVAEAEPVKANTPLARYSKSFENPEGKPTISIIVGGLGINGRRTQAAIDELPPEVTLSFSPTTTNLRTWVRKARRAGHEVLIELPMEPYDYGRLAPHPQVMQVSVDAATNKARLGKLLSKVSGYAGVMNYQGGKFATDQDAAGPVIAELKAKGVAFFEDGSLSRSVFEENAKAEGLPFGKATAWLDARPEADEISKQFMILETAALENGAALGTGMSFPVTLDLLNAWIPRLEDKGIAIAPASYYAKRSVPSGQVKTAALDPQG